MMEPAIGPGETRDLLPDAGDVRALAGLEALVRAVANLPLRARWTPRRLEEEYAARSPAAVLRSGEVSFTAPCVDLASVAAAALARAGLAPTLVLCGIHRPLQAPKFQGGLEVDLGGRTYALGFGLTSTALYAGRFVETPRRAQVHRVHLGAPAFDPEVPFLAWFEPDGRAGVARRVPGYDLERDLRRHARRSSRLHHLVARLKARWAWGEGRPGRVAQASGRWESA